MSSLPNDTQTQVEAAPRFFRIQGTVRQEGRPVADATVRLLGDADTLGAHPAAALETTAHVSWTRPLTGFAGTLWACWNKHVANRVAGLTWPAFRAQAGEYNPELVDDDGRFHAAKTYRLPENNTTAPEIVWDRTVTGPAGNLWQVWQRCVAHRVVGLTYAQFKAEMLRRHPGLARGVTPEDRLDLPRSAGDHGYYLFTTTAARGGFRFDEVPPGRYRLRIRADGSEPFDADLVCSEDMTIHIPLEPVGQTRSRSAAVPRTATRSAARGATGHPWMGVHGDELVAGDRAFRFVGVNVRGLVHYGDRNVLQHSHPGHRLEQLQAAYDMGARVVRIFVANMHAGVEETIARLGATVELVRERFPGLYLLPAFANLYGDVPFRIPGDDGFYAAVPHFHIDLLKPDFFTQGYQQNYLPFVRAVVSAFRDEPIIMAWEVGNELKLDPAGHPHDDDPHLNAFIRFMYAAAQEIRRLDPNHLITTGMISTRHASLNSDVLQERLYATPHFDFLTVHCYNEEYHDDDSPLAQRLHKPFIVEEAGFGRKYGGDRSRMVQQDMDFWYGHGARGYMQWGFMATAHDMGDGDDDAGMDRSLHGDWDPLFRVYRARADELARFDPGWRVEPARPAPVITAPEEFAVGQTVYAQTWLNVRSAPGHVTGGGAILGQIAPGGQASLAGNSVVVDGLTWWPVRTVLADGQTVSGWAAQALPDTALLALTPPALAMPAVHEDAAGRAVTRAAQTVAGQARYALTYINLRREPGYLHKPEGDVLGQIPYGARVEVLRTPVVADDLTWYLVRAPLTDNSVASGWAAETAPDGTALLGNSPPEPVRPPVGGIHGPALRPGDRVAVLAGPVNVRRTPTLADPAPDHVVGIVPQGAELEVTGESRLADGLEWVPVRTPPGAEAACEGWAALVALNGTRILAAPQVAHALRLLRPFAGHAPLTQGWGRRPDIYATISVGGVPLRGHNGLDFGTHIGTPILATDDGEVLKVDYDEKGFGHYIILRHAWGESLYAHLHVAPAVRGGSVHAGQELGQGGNSGWSTGAHLHFGIRIFPYRRTDGWGGFVNPAPLMRPEDLIFVRGARVAAPVATLAETAFV